METLGQLFTPTPGHMVSCSTYLRRTILCAQNNFFNRLLTLVSPPGKVRPLDGARGMSLKLNSTFISDQRNGYGGDSCSKGCESESQYCILDGHFSHLFVVKNALFV